MWVWILEANIGVLIKLSFRLALLQNNMLGNLQTNIYFGLHVIYNNITRLCDIFSLICYPELFWKPKIDTEFCTGFTCKCHWNVYVSLKSSMPCGNWSIFYLKWKKKPCICNFKLNQSQCNLSHIFLQRKINMLIFF